MIFLEGPEWTEDELFGHPLALGVHSSVGRALGFNLTVPSSSLGALIILTLDVKRNRPLCVELVSGAYHLDPQTICH